MPTFLRAKPVVNKPIDGDQFRAEQPTLVGTGTEVYVIMWTTFALFVVTVLLGLRRR
jgi:hypothetical protein